MCVGVAPRTAADGGRRIANVVNGDFPSSLSVIAPARLVSIFICFWEGEGATLAEDDAFGLCVCHGSTKEFEFETRSLSSTFK